MNLFGRKKILIVNDQKDVGVSYTPFFNDIGQIENNPVLFELSPRAFHLVVFTGGSDVSPELYEDSSPKGICGCNKKRDKQELKLFNLASAYKIPMYGICRGLQFINVMAGGMLIHDLSGHNSLQHRVNTSDNMKFEANSFHHQACLIPMESELLAWSEKKLSARYIGKNDEVFSYTGPEVEAAYFEEYNAVGVQWHPEAMNRTDSAAKWAHHLARDLMKGDRAIFEKIYSTGSLKVSYAN
jgi:gamma-glutamyl-gamma-aminobutyrate hydrolase PuuD